MPMIVCDGKAWFVSKEPNNGKDLHFDAYKRIKFGITRKP